MPDLRPLRVLQTTSQLLQAKHLKQQPAWLPTVARTPPSTDISRKPPPSFHATPTTSTSSPLRRSGSRGGGSKKVRRVFEPQRIKYPEDKLRERFYREHPWELARPVLLVETSYNGRNSASHDWSRMIQKGKALSGESVIQRQRYLMTSRDPPLSKDEAYLVACREFYALRTAEAIEARVAVEEALAFGAQFNKSQVQIGLELEAEVVGRWREKALHAKSLVQPANASTSVSSSAALSALSFGGSSGSGAMMGGRGGRHSVKTGTRDGFGTRDRREAGLLGVDAALGTEGLDDGAQATSEERDVLDDFQ